MGQKLHIVTLVGNPFEVIKYVLPIELDQINRVYFLLALLAETQKKVDVH